MCGQVGAPGAVWILGPSTQNPRMEEGRLAKLQVGILEKASCPKPFGYLQSCHVLSESYARRGPRTVVTILHRLIT